MCAAPCLTRRIVGAPPASAPGSLRPYAPPLTRFVVDAAPLTRAAARPLPAGARRFVAHAPETLTQQAVTAQRAAHEWTALTRQAATPPPPHPRCRAASPRWGEAVRATRVSEHTVAVGSNATVRCTRVDSTDAVGRNTPVFSEGAAPTQPRPWRGG